MNREEMPCPRHPHGVAVSRQSQPGGNVTGVIFGRPPSVSRNLHRGEPYPLGVRRAMPVPIKSRVVHQNGEPAPNQEHQKKEVHKMSQPQPGREPMRNRRRCRIDCRQGSLRWQPGDQILSPCNRHWKESDHSERNNKPGIHPDAKTAIRWIVDSSMALVECLHKQWILVSIALLRLPGVPGGMFSHEYRRPSDGYIAPSRTSRQFLPIR